MSLNNCIDHTCIRPTATKNDIINLCDDCYAHRLRGVCVAPQYVYLASEELKDDPDSKVSAVIGFPFGYTTTPCKIVEAEMALLHGANELDVVWNIGLFRGGKYLKVLNELSCIVNKANKNRVKVIVEECYLRNDYELRLAYKIVKDSGAYAIKTSTGCGVYGAKTSTVALWSSMEGDLKIKAAGGIRTKEQVLNLINNGADIIGTSHSLNIIEGTY